MEQLVKPWTKREEAEDARRMFECRLKRDRETRIRSDVMDCTLSLSEAVQQAGGAISDRLLDMSVREFIATVAGQNHIRFVYARPEDDSRQFDLDQFGASPL